MKSRVRDSLLSDYDLVNSQQRLQWEKQESMLERNHAMELNECKNKVGLPVMWFGLPVHLCTPFAVFGGYAESRRGRMNAKLIVVEFCTLKSSLLRTSQVVFESIRFL